MTTKKSPIAKITRPVLIGIFPRKRLFRQLESSRDKPIIWTTGPPGCGKTTLIASYLDASKIPSLWYMVDEGDADIATFFYYMGLAAKKAVPQKRKPLPLLTPEYRQGIPTFTQRYFENLYSRLKTPFIMVLDNYQMVPAESEFHEVISHGLSVIPEKINVIVISRESLPAQLVRLQANNKINFLGWDKIRFTLDESRKIFRMKGHREPTEETIQQLHKKTEGWVAGLVLMTEIAKIENIDYQLLNKIIPEKIFDYFASEIFNKTDKETQDFLLMTALLPQITLHVAEALAGNLQANRILSDLNQKNYFTQRYVHHTVVYQYHPLFREFLLERVKKTFTPEHIPKIQRYAAAILENNGQIEDAMGLFREAREWLDLARLILKQAPAMIAQGRGQTLEDWIGTLPKTLVEKNSWLLYWMGACRMPFNSTESREKFEKAFELFKTQKDVPGIFLAWSGVVESIVYGYEGLKPLDRWFSILDELLKEFKKLPSEEIGGRVTCSVIRGLAFRRPPHFPMELWAERAFAIAQTTTNIPLKIESLVNLACYRYSGVELQRLETILDSLKELLKRMDLSPLVLLIVSWVKAAYANLTSMYDHCLKVVSDGLELANDTGIHVMDYMLRGLGALSSLKAGDFMTAKKYLQEMASSLNSAKPWEVGFYHYVAAWEALYRKNLSKAPLHSELCLKLCEEIGNPWTLSMAHLQRAFIFHTSGEDKKMTEHLAEARLIGTQSKNEYTRFACLLTKAYFSLQKGDEASAVKLLREGMQIGRERGFVNLYMWLPGVMESITTKALDVGIEVSYVQDIIRRNALVPESPFLEIENWPWPLKIYTFGKFELLKDGKPFCFSGKVQKKPLLMLKALIALGGKDIREESLADICWPDADGDAAHSAFTTTLSRLRYLIGNEKAIQFNVGRATLDPCYCWVDVWVFERILGQAEALWKDSRLKDPLTEAVQLIEKAIDIYKGHFLVDEVEQPWTVSLRERLKSKFIRLIDRSGYYYEQTEQWEKAVEYYQRGLEVDDLTEEFYQRLMTCYQRIGRRGDAIAVYQRCRRILSAVLGIEPSPETEAIYKTLCVEKG
jgi:LuxR family maltose regulon positive regulatory protein